MTRRKMQAPAPKSVAAERAALGVAAPADIQQGAQEPRAGAHAVDVRPHANLRADQRPQAVDRMALLQQRPRRQLAQLKRQPERLL